jgi:hypothetical protein
MGRVMKGWSDEQHCRSLFIKSDKDVMTITFFISSFCLITLQSKVKKMKAK